MTRFTAQKALKSIVPGKLTFDEKVVLHRVARAIQGNLDHKNPPPPKTTIGP